MSVQVPTAFVQQYKANVELLLQQKGSVLRNTVRVETAQGKGAKLIEQVGQVNPQRKVGRHTDTPLIDTPHDARWAHPVDWEWADLIDSQDKVRMLIDPQSPYAENGAYAMGRAIDDEIIAAFFATSAVGEDGTDTEAFDTATYQIVVGGAGLTVSKLRTAKRLLMAAHVDVVNDPLFVAVTAQQHDDLLNETQAINLDYTTRPVLMEGSIQRFMGFNFIHTERLGTDGSGDQRCPCWAKSGMALAIWDDIQVEIDRRADKSYATQVYTKVTCGATRTQQGKVVEIICDL